ncbi:hypothetical protein [uncultured Allobaculum sp.]|uniref:hypothetical protein n=1 Tax=uncultured Allobaculum sp. TaxID=1187017 RepID=UPI00259130DF|nr:hypothetical protein [uncultured Allobaculum sp.]
MKNKSSLLTGTIEKSGKKIALLEAGIAALAVVFGFSILVLIAHVQSAIEILLFPDGLTMPGFAAEWLFAAAATLAAALCAVPVLTRRFRRR